MAITPASLVWVDVGGGKGPHPAFVLEIDPSLDALIITGTSQSTRAPMFVLVDPHSPAHRQALGACLVNKTYFYADYLRWASVGVLKPTKCRAPTRLMIALRYMIPQSPPPKPASAKPPAMDHAHVASSVGEDPEGES